MGVHPVGAVVVLAPPLCALPDCASPACTPWAHKGTHQRHHGRQGVLVASGLESGECTAAVL